MRDNIVPSLHNCILATRSLSDLLASHSRVGTYGNGLLEFFPDTRLRNLYLAVLRIFSIGFRSGGGNKPVLIRRGWSSLMIRARKPT